MEKMNIRFFFNEYHDYCYRLCPCSSSQRLLVSQKNANKALAGIENVKFALGLGEEDFSIGI